MARHIPECTVAWPGTVTDAAGHDPETGPSQVLASLAFADQGSEGSEDPATDREQHRTVQQEAV